MTLASFVDGTDLSHWADRRDAESTLPRLLRRLIHATVALVERIALPADEGVQLGGWDGVVQVARGNAYVPDGLSVWELGRSRAVKGKADDDYEKRTADPLGLDPLTVTFVFVTPRRWGGKDRWIANKKGEGRWGDVRAYDADDLAAWLESAPAVHAWLSRLLGKHPEGVVDIDHFWREWRAVTSPPTSTALVIAGRHDAARAIQERLQGPASIASLRADSRDEALAFFAAVMQQLPPEERVEYLARGVVVESVAAWGQLATSVSPLVLLLAFDDRRAAAAAATRGHHVLVPLGNGDAPSRETIDLPRPHRDGVRGALVELGVPGAAIDDLATLGRCSPTALRRRLAIDPAVLSPHWSWPSVARALLPALLVGRWDDTNPADRELLARLAGGSYTALSESLTRWANEPDPPVRRVGDIWVLASREDAWPLLARFLTGDDLRRFEAATLAALGEVDPRHALPMAERRLAGLLGRGHAHSGHLREGLAETLAILATHSDSVSLVGATPGQVWADRIARQLLAGATGWPLWGSLTWLLPLLAEASPDIVLRAVDRGLAGERPVLAYLFTDHGDDFDGGFDSSLHTGLLWALETLAWSPDYFGQAVPLLAALARLDPGGRNANRPADSLHEIFLCWHPHTSAGFDQRLRVLDRLREREPAVSWRLLLGLLTKEHETSHSTATPRWRDWATTRSSAITTGELVSAATEVARRLLSDVGTNGCRWGDLIARVDRLPRAEFEAAAARLNEADLATFSSADRRIVWDSLRAVISRHTAYPDAPWAMKGEQIEPLRRAYARFEPADPLVRHAWLFSDRPEVLVSGEDDWQGRNVALETARADAVRALHAGGGVPLLLTFAVQVERPWYVGHALGRSDLLADREDDLLAQTLGAPNAAHRDLALGYLRGRAARGGHQWLEAIRTSEVIARGTPQGRADLYRCLPFEARTWDQMEALDEETRRLYWSGAPVWGLAEVGDDDHARVVANLVRHGHLEAAIHFIALYARENHARVPAPIIADMLAGAIEAPNQATIDWDALDHDVATLLDVLDAAAEIDTTQVARFEWFFLPLLTRQRDPRTLHRALATDPAFFNEVLRWVYHADGDESRELSEEGRARARLGLEVFWSWRRPPSLGSGDDIDAAALRDWATAAHELAHGSGRGAVGDGQIGQVLAHVPAGADGAWPHEAVRDLLEDLRSDDLERGLATGVANRRGVVTRALGDSGAQERALAAVYLGHARLTQDRWPRITRVLHEIAGDYEAHGRRVDVVGALEQDTWR